MLPELDAVAVQVSERVRRYFGEAESYDDFQPGTDVSQIFDVREYRPGDRLQRIHWKLSAKSDGLLVRETVSRLPVRWYFCWTCCHRWQEKASI